MRPTAGTDTTITRSRKPSDPVERPTNTSTTFFLTQNPDSDPISRTIPSSKEPDISPVRSLKETLREAEKHGQPWHRQQEVRSSSRRRSTIRPQIVDAVRESSHQLPSPQLPSGTATPFLSSSREPSLPSSPKSVSTRSLSKSEDDLLQEETGSQAVAFSDDGQDEELPSEVQDSAPQLIMPSINMPSRRPFTERGKQIGRFKILVAGRKGSGRTSLIKSIVQLCEDIVHVDSVSVNSKPVSGHRKNNPQSQLVINEIYASTRPYPSWWSDIDESRVLRRRKSVGDSVLERNLCFVETIDSGRSETVLQYLERDFIQLMNNINTAEYELTGLLSGRGGSQVDVILYLLSRDTWKEDCNSVQRMNQLCNVIPLISKSDQLSAEMISELKATEFPGTVIPHLPPDKSSDPPIEAQAPYSVSSANGPDFDNMDASLLMSSEYVRPLLPSELASLITHLFDPNTVSYLRYTSAKKITAWHSSGPKLTSTPPASTRSTQPSTLNSPLPTSLSNSGVLIPVTSELSLNTSNSYALAKLADHTQREEHLAQIRLSKWASDLQLSLQRERERYECLAQNERALWLVQRMGEEIRDGQVIPLQNAQALVKVGDKTRFFHPELRYEAHDPLGLLRWQDMMRTSGWAALQIVGSFGVVGGVALWLARTWGLTSTLQEWLQEWNINIFSNNE